MAEKDNRAAAMRIEPLTAALGAELSGIDLKELDADAALELRTALLEHKVVGIRDQFLDDAGHIRLGEALGEPWIHPMDRLAGADRAEPSELRVTSDHRLLPDLWHLDVLYAPNPPAFGILRAVDVPPVGGDTMWANLVLAASWLPDELRERLQGRSTVHSVPDTLINLKQTMYPGRIQPVVVTPGCCKERRCSLRASAGVFHPRVLRGRELMVAATAWISSAVHRDRSVRLGK